MIKRGYSFYMEVVLYLETSDFNLVTVLKEGLKNDLAYVDSEVSLNKNKKQALSAEETIKILNKSLSETSFVTLLYKNTTISLWLDKNNKKISFTLSFLSENLFERNYLPDTTTDIDIYTYSNIIIQWLKPFGIEQLHIEYCKP